jgi:DNA-binding transcriptional MerR regulator
MQGEFIGKASRDTGLSIDTIRFYEKLGLIEHPARTCGEFRIFSVEDIHDLRVIRRLVSLGFSLSETRHCLGCGARTWMPARPSAICYEESS